MFTIRRIVCVQPAAANLSGNCSNLATICFAWLFFPIVFTSFGYSADVIALIVNIDMEYSFHGNGASSLG